MTIITSTTPSIPSGAGSSLSSHNLPTMAQLYTRLGKIGFTRKFVQENILPDWWEDAAAKTPAGYSEIVGIIAGFTGIAIESFYQDNLRFEEPLEKPLYKLKQNTKAGDVELARNLAVRVARLAAFARKPVSTPSLTLAPDVSEIRQDIARQGSPVVTFEVLLDYCWRIGIPVLHLHDFPKSKGNHKMDAMAVRICPIPGSIWSNERYVIVLCCNHRHPAWHLFHLAHELGHIALGHLQNTDVLIDESIGEDSQEDIQEVEANAFAHKLLIGNAPTDNFGGDSDPNPQSLSITANHWQENYQVDAGYLLLSYAHFVSKQLGAKSIWNIVQKALALLPGSDAGTLIRDRIRTGLDFSALSDDNATYLQQITGAVASAA